MHIIVEILNIFYLILIYDDAFVKVIHIRIFRILNLTNLPLNINTAHFLFDMYI
jgi:hypothetical protein